MSAAVDASTPIRWAGTPAALGNSTSASFTAPTDALLVLCLNADGGTANLTIAVTDTGGLTWTERVRRDITEATTGGHSSIWTARTTSTTARTVNWTRTGGDSSGKQVSAKLYVVTGVDVGGTPVDTVSAANEGGSATNNLTTTSVTPGANGLLFVCDTEWNALGNFEASSNLTEDKATYTGISVDSGYRTCSSGVGVTANLNAFGAAAAQHKWCQVVVREAAAGGATVRPRSLLTTGCGC